MCLTKDLAIVKIEIISKPHTHTHLWNFLLLLSPWLSQPRAHSNLFRVGKKVRNVYRLIHSVRKAGGYVYRQENVFTVCTLNVCISVRRQSGENGISERKSNIVL